MIVVDTNVIVYLFIHGEHQAAAEALLVRERHWASPLLWRSEFRNVLTGYLRRKEMSFDEACSLLAEAENLFASNEYQVASASVLELVAASDCSAYDCEFVALAMKLGVPLVTMDRKLLKAFPQQAIPLSASA